MQPDLLRFSNKIRVAEDTLRNFYFELVAAFTLLQVARTALRTAIQLASPRQLWAQMKSSNGVKRRRAVEHKKRGRNRQFFAYRVFAR